MQVDRPSKTAQCMAAVVPLERFEEPGEVVTVQEHDSKQADRTRAGGCFGGCRALPPQRCGPAAVRLGRGPSPSS